MSCASKLHRLCHLIDDSLHPYTEPGVISLTKDKEKDLLIALSQVLRQIQLMNREVVLDSDKELARESDCDEEYSGRLELHHEDHNCLTKIVADLIILLTVDSQFVQHLLGSILVVISEFLTACGNDWYYFIQSLFICLELSIANMSSHCLEPATNGAGDSKFDSSSFVILKSRLENANWSTAAAIFQVLRNILKYLKQEDDDQLREKYLGSVGAFLSHMPWDIMDYMQVGQNSDNKERDSPHSHCLSDLSVGNMGKMENNVLFLGNFVQFLCSLVEQSYAVEAKLGSEDNHPVVSIIISFVPKLLCWSLGKRGDYVNRSTSHYFKHKMLMLMLRLSYQTCLGCSTLISWLELLHDYFEEFLCEELLWKSVNDLEFGQNECLEGSPFFSSFSDGETHRINSHHLQRWAILLFLRCCFGLISVTRDTSKQCACVTRNSCLTSILDMGCCGRKKGFLELSKWLQRHLPTGMFVDCDMYMEKCMGFASSFLQLYTHEDDVLFKVLLQLLRLHSCLDQQLNGEKWILEDIKEDILFNFLNVFNPVYLFHIFLAELHYDYQVLLDYLISKDTGSSCAEYLLRCLRTVCNSWHLFVTFPMHENVTNRSSFKKRKVALDGSNIHIETSSLPLKGISSSLEQKCKKDLLYSHKHRKIIRQQQLKEAKNCLLSLKDSVENLHQKNLFPYNPEVLLKRLTKFEELCFAQKNHDFSSTGGTV